jgi:hypothetical protein
MSSAQDNHHDGSQPSTQAAFGTQNVQSAQHCPNKDGPTLLGRKQLEPILEGNTKREELKLTTTALEDEKKAKLLSLLPQPAARRPIVGKPHLDRTSGQQRSDLGNTSAQLFTQLPPPVTNELSPRATKPESPATASPRAPQATDKSATSKDLAPASTKKRKPPHKDEITPSEPEGETAISALQTRCSWMKDFEFTRAAFKVHYHQASILSNAASWHKSLPGQRFPTGNIPIRILNTIQRLTDEDAASGAQPDSSDEDLEQDSSTGETVEPFEASSASVAETSEVLSTQVEDTPSSMVSWSPTPEPLPAPPHPAQTLPPDSSSDMQDTTELQSDTVQGDPRDLANKCPPSSPPNLDALDEDVEMESFVPQALGEVLRVASVVGICCFEGCKYCLSCAGPGW